MGVTTKVIHFPFAKTMLFDQLRLMRNRLRLFFLPCVISPWMPDEYIDEIETYTRQ